MPPAANSQQALANLQSYQGGMQKPEQALATAQQQVGVGGAQERLSGLRGTIAQTTGLLNRVAPSVYGRTQNSLVSNAQADRQIGNERAPIERNLGQYTQDYNQANADYNELNRQAESRAGMAITGQNGQLSYLQSLYQTLAGQEQTQRDEAYRQQVFAEQKRAASASANGGLSSLASLFGGGGSSSSSANKPLEPNEVIRGLLAGYKDRLPGYTERTALPKLIATFPKIDPKKLEQMLYEARKPLEAPKPQPTGRDLYGRTQVMA